MNFLRKAFTLAEVVMVIGIIGIIAILTITNATKDTSVAEKVALLRRSDEILSEAFAQAVAEKGPVTSWATTSPSAPASEVWQTIQPYLKVQKNCNTSSGCWSSGTVGSTNVNSSTSHYKAILANGASVAYVYSSSIDVHHFLIDVDGKDKGPFVMGEDVFEFQVNKSGEVLPFVGNNNDLNARFEKCKAGNYNYCTAWVLRYGNQDYLKSCKNELSWSGKHSCRD